MDQDRYNKGLKIRTAVLGEAYVTGPSSPTTSSGHSRSS